MSHRHHCHHHKHQDHYEPETCTPFGFLNPYTLIILILIVLQWFRIGSQSDGAHGPQPSLVSNGGLFIITLFLLVYCSCGMGSYGKKEKEYTCKCKCKYR